MTTYLLPELQNRVINVPIDEGSKLGDRMEEGGNKLDNEKANRVVGREVMAVTSK